jgi:hypothetical protein
MKRLCVFRLRKKFFVFMAVKSGLSSDSARRCLERQQESTAD